GGDEALDEQEDEDVAEGVEALGARPAGVADGGLEQARAGPVVELAVGHARRPAGGGAAVADGLVEGGDVLREEDPLGGPGLVPGAGLRAGGVSACAHRSSSEM